MEYLCVAAARTALNHRSRGQLMLPQKTSERVPRYLSSQSDRPPSPNPSPASGRGVPRSPRFPRAWAGRLALISASLSGTTGV